MGLAERADVIVDFRNLPDGTVVRMINTAPDPTSATPATDPWNLQPCAERSLERSAFTWPVSLNKEESALVCVLLDPVNDTFVEAIEQVDCANPSPTPENFEVVPFGPTAALLGQVELTGAAPVGIPLKWTEIGTGIVKIINVPGGSGDVWVTENQALDSIESFEIYNFTEDAHPIHLHLVRFQLIGREVIGGGTSAAEQNTPLP